MQISINYDEKIKLMSAIVYYRNSLSSDALVQLLKKQDIEDLDKLLEKVYNS